MSVRPFDWRDLPALHRYRHHVVFLDTALVLTRGPMLVPGALLSYMAPTMGIITAVCNGGEAGPHSLFGQVMHASGGQVGRLTFLTPDAALETPALPVLLEHLAAEVGARGGLRLLADVDERSQAFEMLRHNGFAIYSRQRVWKFSSSLEGGDRDCAWSPANSRDMIAIRSLYHNIVPGLVQQTEPFAAQRPQGMVYRQDGDLLAYVELKYAPRGIWAQPFVHPDAEDISGPMTDLFQHLPYRRARPIYLCVRSYQSWLEPAIEDLGAVAGPRQAVMVKQLAIPQKAARMFTLPVLEGGHPEVSAPIARSESK